MAQSACAGPTSASSFESRGRLYFLFGDSFTLGGGTLFDDSIAVTDARSADRFRMPRLSWAAGADGSFAPLRVQGASHGSFEVPVEGIHAAAGPTCSSSAAGDAGSYDHQVLGHFDADTMQTGRFVFDQVVETSRFLNVSAVEYEGYVYLFGAGNPYRGALCGWPASARGRSTVTISGASSASRCEDGTRALGAGRRATPARSSTDSPPCVGELSVRRDPTSGYFLMAYNCDDDQRRPPARVLPADGAPALGTVERTDRAVRRHGGRQRL